MAQQMTRDEYLSFLGEGTRTGKLATAAADGRPHVVPIWFVLDGETIVFTMWSASAKARHIRRDPRLALCVDDERPPFAFAMVEGTAEVSDDLAEMLPWATRIAGRYMGPDLAESYGRRNAVPGELLVRLRPLRVIAQKGIAD
jgi:PPOX class probable F420-dependent enzyme